MTKAIQPQPAETDPWTEIDRQFDALRSGLLDGFGLWTSAPTDPTNLVRAARADVTDTGAAFRIVAELPGIPKEKVDVRVRGSLVEIRGEAAEETEAKPGAYVQHERRYAGYYRAFDLPEAVVAADATAKVTNGLLELDLPKLHPSPSQDEVRIPVA